MAKWYEGAEEAAFKPVAEGYVFQAPNPWPFGRTRSYLVNEAQKARLAARLRRMRRQILLLAGLVMLLAVVLSAVVGMTGAGDALSLPAFAAIVAVTILVMLSVPLVPHLLLMRDLPALLAGLQRTDERVTVGEQLQSVATSISVWLLVLGGVGGALMVIGNIVSLADAISHGRSGTDLYGSVLALAFGLLLTGYFSYLGILKAKLKRDAN
jgi:hypothetical protein